MRSNARCASASLTILLRCFDLRETKFVSPDCHSCHSVETCTRLVHVGATLQLISAHKYTFLDNSQYLWRVECGGCRWGTGDWNFLWIWQNVCVGVAAGSSSAVCLAMISLYPPSVKLALQCLFSEALPI